MRSWLSLFEIWACYLRSLKGWRRYGMALLFGTMSGLAFPPFNAVPALWFFFPSLVFLLQGTIDKRRAFAIGWCFAFGQLIISLYWIAGALFVDIGQFWWLVPFAALGLPAVFAIYYGIATLIAFHWGLARFDGLLMLALMWAMADYARGHLFTGLPWDVTGYVWGDVLSVMQIVSVIGIYGLSLITLIIVMLPAALLFQESKRQGIFLVIVSLFFLLAITMWGRWRIVSAPEEFVPNVHLRLVQPDVDQARKWKYGERDIVLQKLLTLSFASAEKPVTHIIWPETATAFYLSEDEETRQAIVSHMESETALITGVIQRDVKPDGETAYFNSLIVINNQGKVVSEYAKFHLVPFGEYVPFRSILPFRAVAAIGDFTPGGGLQTLRVPGLPSFSPLVCYEAIFSSDVVRKDDRPQFLLNITNDAWYDGTTGPYQHFSIVRARAIEEGLPLVRVANKGINGIVDAYGRIIASQAWGKPGFVDGNLPRDLPGGTIFSRFGNSFFWLFSMILLAFLSFHKISLRRQ